MELQSWSVNQDRCAKLNECCKYLLLLEWYPHSGRQCCIMSLFFFFCIFLTYKGETVYVIELYVCEVLGSVLPLLFYLLPFLF